MTSETVLTLRSRLRADTAAQHARLDEAISTADVSTRSGFARFMQTHHAAFRAIDAVAPRAELRDLADRAGHDLASLGVATGSIPDAGVPLDRDAVEYVLQGSRLGTKVLRRRWQESTDPQVQAADAYFDAPIDPSAWRATCDALEARPASGAASDRVVSDARRIFDIFQTALARAPGEKGHQLA
ncbi:biliverdin-producing heme oxygenase [Palleronia sp.]|uniref:biliverdin-producing heme oxygenase n=1 Tax=Palleronia sp. TaxID=1940284 RepID=UPI0035C84C4B